MRFVKSLLMASIAMMTIVAASCTDDAENRVASNAYLKNTEVKGESKNCAVVLEAQQGTSYSLTIASDGEWATFTSGQLSINGTMESRSKVVYIYFSKNATGTPREAEIEVNIAGEIFSLSFTQHSYDNTIAVARAWAELPVCKEENNYIYNTHFGAMGLRNDARNYTYCFDPSVRASLWVAYPLHKCYTSGEGNRNNSSFGYDPKVDDEVQAALGRGSYNGWYDRGHQLPAADRKCSQQMMDQTFYATNMTPQQSSFNQNKWGVLEGRVRNMVCSDTLYVVTGAYFGGEHHSSIANKTTDKLGNTCPTPTHYYKALLRTKKGNTGKSIDEFNDASQVRAIAFWFEHENSGDDTTITSSDCISVAELEEITGFIFFPMLDDAIEAEVKSTKIPSEWGVN